METEPLNQLAPQSEEQSSRTPSTLESLQQMRDEIRVQLHLASLAAQQRWHELEGELDQVVQRVGNTTVEASRLVDATKENVRGAIDDTKDSLRGVIDDLHARFDLFRESLRDVTKQ